MFRKFFRNRGKKSSYAVETDSVPSPPREVQAAPIDIPDPLHIRTRENIISENSNEPNNSLPQPQNYESLQKSPIPAIHLSISHSHGFQIGDIHNITVSNGSVAHINAFPSSLGSHLLPKTALESRVFGTELPNETAVVNNELPNTPTLESVLYDYSKIKDWHLSLISENFQEDWKSLAQALETPRTEIEEIERRNRENSKTAVLEILKRHLHRYPDTSIGFITSILQEIGQSQALEKLIRTF